MWYAIIALILFIPAVWYFTWELDPEDGFERAGAAFLGLVAAVAWPLSLVLVIGAGTAKYLEKARRGSRLEVKWRNK